MYLLVIPFLSFTRCFGSLIILQRHVPISFLEYWWDRAAVNNIGDFVETLIFMELMRSEPYIGVAEQWRSLVKASKSILLCWWSLAFTLTSSWKQVNLSVVKKQASINVEMIDKSIESKYSVVSVLGEKILTCSYLSHYF